MLIQHVLQVFPLLFVALSIHVQAHPCDYTKTFDFDSVPKQHTCFRVDPVASGTLSTVKAYAKHGTRSLRWKITASAGSTLQLKSSAFSIPNSWLPSGGVKVWIYKKTAASAGRVLQVQFIHHKMSGNTVVGQFPINLNFEGWRGIWVKFAESKVRANSLAPPALINQVNFAVAHPDTIYIDILGFEESFGKQSRDKVVPPIAPFGLTLYDESHTWQQAYKWSQVLIPSSPATIDTRKTLSLAHIESRLKSWYFDERKTSSNGFLPGGSHLESRWNSLMDNAKQAHKEYDRLVTGRVFKGPPLFCRDCRYGTTKYSSTDPTRKFGFIMEKILLPLALEFHLRSRATEVSEAAAKQLPELNSGNRNRKRAAIRAIAGPEKEMQKAFKRHLTSTGPPLTEPKVVTAIGNLNNDRLDKITNLLNHVQEQGWADGSALGSLDHELNLDGAGFTHTLFLMKDSLSSTRLSELIATAKWYNDFGEIYQSPAFEYKGTTADRMITIMLFRLLIILVMPSTSNPLIKAKIRDMEALVRWMDNALAINEGLAGVVKPDFTGYHHKSFYGSAYVPQALHNAALLQYLLGGTEFSLSPSSTNNIRRGLETLRMICVKYSTPNSVNGRFPNYHNQALIKTALPAYAYISVAHPSIMPTAVSPGINVADVRNPEMFLRLYQDHAVDSYLDDGRVGKGKYYLNSLGSLDIMEKVETASGGLSSESSPEGHWSKNFAVLSVHRRDDWAVTMRGFNHFSWDFENSPTQNVFGIFNSHGALLVTNSEEKLEVHDVEKGWDWAKVPGATTIALPLSDLQMSKGRFYNKRSLAGGVTFKGSQGLANGLFGMDFEQPNYGFKNWRKYITFVFKKSVFFFENLLVCLGSNIKAQYTKSTGKRRVLRVQTTLFQDKLVDGVPTSFIEIDGTSKWYNPLYPVSTPSSTSGTSYTTLTDAKENGYYIPGPGASMLKVQVQDQSSKSDDGSSCPNEHYGTAWFDHPSSLSNYEYAVLIPTTSYTAGAGLDDIRIAQESVGNKAYEVLQKDATAHVVQFRKSPRNWPSVIQPTTGYVIFTSTTSLPAGGPLQAVNGECLIMVEETTDFLYLGISFPNLDFLTTSGVPPENSDDIGEDELYHSSSREKAIVVTLRFLVEGTIRETKVHGDPDIYAPVVSVRPSPPNPDKGKTITFSNLKNGFSVEVKLKK